MNDILNYLVHTTLVMSVMSANSRPVLSKNLCVIFLFHGKQYINTRGQFDSVAAPLTVIRLASKKVARRTMSELFAY